MPKLNKQIEQTPSENKQCMLGARQETYKQIKQHCIDNNISIAEWLQIQIDRIENQSAVNQQIKKQQSNLRKNL
jgi:hypothetical protein